MIRSAPKSLKPAPKKVQVCTSPAARAVAYLRSAHPTKTAEQVEAATGIAAATVKNWLLGIAAPGGDAMARLVVCYGPELICVLCDAAPPWLAASARATRQAAIEAEQARLEMALANLRSAA